VSTRATSQIALTDRTAGKLVASDQWAAIER
jgi:hypothetical protein